MPSPPPSVPRSSRRLCNPTAFTQVNVGNETWTIRRVLEWTSGYLTRKGDDKARLAAQWLVSDATGLSRVELYTHYDQPLTAEELAHLHAAIERRATGEPLQYVTGEMPFRNIVLRCEREVLIPRPETEVLVDAALEGVDAALSTRDEQVVIGPVLDEVEPVRVLDLCTGTGCIAASIASERTGVEVVATDLSPAAVTLATRNVAALGLEDRVTVIECDLATDVDEELMGSFDVLVSNPPYIPTEVLDGQVPAEVKNFEPRLALDGGPDGLDIFRRILELAPTALAPGGMLCVELFEESLDDAVELVKAQGGWSHVEAREDYTHRPRVLVAIR